MKNFTCAIAIVLTGMVVSSEAMAASSLRLARYTNILNTDYFPSSDTITHERAVIAGMPARICYRSQRTRQRLWHQLKYV